MSNNNEILTKLNLIFSSILWVLSFLIFLFNLLGLWAPWHLAGYAALFYSPFSIVLSILSIVLTVKEKKVFIKNLIFLGISVFSILFFVLVTLNWFW